MNLLLPMLLFFAPAAVANSSLSAEAKLAKQWLSYETARKTFSQRAAAGQPMSRDEWERLLMPQREQVLTDPELTSLRKQQDAAVDKALASARAGSAISLDRIRAEKKAAELCADLPKGGLLHLHYPYLLSPTILFALLAEQDPVLPLEELRKTLRLIPDASECLAKYKSPTRFSSIALTDREGLKSALTIPNGQSVPFNVYKAKARMVDILIHGDPWAKSVVEAMWKKFLEDARAKKIQYVEVSFGFPVDAETEAAFDRAVGMARKTYGLTLRGVVAFQRGAVSSIKPSAAALPRSSNFVAVDSYAEETQNPILETGQLIFTKRPAKLHVKTHAGERGNPDNVRDALLLGAERIGHGVLLVRHPIALEYAIQSSAAIETQLTSNLKLGVWPNVETHPFLRFLRLGLRVSLGTDNQTVLSTDLNNECRLAVEATDVQYAELRQLVLNSIQSSFVEPSVGKQIHKDVSAQLSAFEARWARRPR